MFGYLAKLWNIPHISNIQSIKGVNICFLEPFFTTFVGEKTMGTYTYQIEDWEFGPVRVRSNRRARRFIFRADGQGLVLTCHPRAREQDMRQAMDTLRPRLRTLLEKEKERQASRPTADMVRLLAKQAKEALPPRLHELAKKHGFQYNKVTIRNMHTRWGSCSAKGNIGLSIYILTLPEHLQDYVMLHELCHTRQMNHSPKFWALLDSLVEGRNGLYRREMRHYNISSHHA